MRYMSLRYDHTQFGVISFSLLFIGGRKNNGTKKLDVSISEAGKCRRAADEVGRGKSTQD